MTGADREPFAAGASEAARLAREVQDLGFDAARIIVERFVEVFAQFTAGAGGQRANDEGQALFGPAWSEGSARQLQSDLQRATESYVTMLGQLSEASFRFFDATRWREPSQTEREDLCLPDVAPGGRASARLWLHNTTGSAVSDLRPWCPGLADHGGVSLPASVVTCAPGRIERLDPGQSRELVVTIAVGQEATPGTYHGQLLVAGLPDVVFPIRARVRSASNGS